MPKQYPKEFKKQVAAICTAGTSLAVISEKYHISLNTLYRWRKEYQSAENQNAAKDVSALHRQLERQGLFCKSFDFLISLMMCPAANAWKFWQSFMNSLSSTTSMNYVRR